MAKEESIVGGMAGRYALALFDLAKEQRATDAVAADLNAFRALVEESSDLERLVKSPVFSAEEQVKALTALLSRARIGGLAANFIKLVASKRRLFAIGDMIAGFEQLNDAAKGVVRAHVTVAEPLSPARLDALKAALVAISGSPSVDVTVDVDRAIIGGLVVKLGSRMVDSSLKTKLDTIRTRMKEVG
ncbi:MAG TPA: F0F1 ATP synthase subunit delta [Beijerinckiaceae bacterium]|nr:F0F1 ATP synthase subunit delta [Beijerinckiaceae bacterium]